LAVDVPPHCSAAVESQGQIGFTKQKIGFVILEKRRKMGSFDSFAIKFLTVSEFVFHFFFRVAPSGPVQSLGPYSDFGPFVPPPGCHGPARLPTAADDSVTSQEE